MSGWSHGGNLTRIMAAIITNQPQFNKLREYRNLNCIEVAALCSSVIVLDINCHHAWGARIDLGIPIAHKLRAAYRLLPGYVLR